MKYMFVSDIHGNLEIFERIIELFEAEKADKLILLGDTSGGYYSNFNFEIAEIINSMNNKVEIIRGNCDSEEFEDMLECEVFDDDLLFVPQKRSDKNDNGISFNSYEEKQKDYITISITHGHRYNFQYLPPNCGDIFIQGHTHIPVLFESNGRIFANPGSPTRPRGSDLKCYIIVNNEKIELKSFSGETINEIKF